jgi:hypothetical protein
MQMGLVSMVQSGHSWSDLVGVVVEGLKKEKKIRSNEVVSEN